MPATSAVIARLKEAGFKFDEQKEHCVFLRKLVDGKPKIIRVQRKKELDEVTARSLLRQGGLTEEQLRDFFRACNA